MELFSLLSPVGPNNVFLVPSAFISLLAAFLAESSVHFLSLLLTDDDLLKLQSARLGNGPNTLSIENGDASTAVIKTDAVVFF